MEKGAIFGDTVFQSTPPYGGDLGFLLLFAQWMGFQSTPPYGGDNAWAIPTIRQPDFNPRPHTGATSVGILEAH